MQDLKNKIKLSFSDNPELADAFSGKKVGDKCKLTVELMVDELSGEGIVGSIEEITPEGYSKQGEGEDESKEIAPPDDESPVMMVIAGKAKKKSPMPMAA